MTIWNNIYNHYFKGGQAWASLSEEIHPQFIQFTHHSIDNLKYALDIGCGTGKYLKLLQTKGVKTAGLDSSKTAVKITRTELGDDSIIYCSNMYDFKIPQNRYDLIISISTIHHGTKTQIQTLINQIHQAIIDQGKIFITLPEKTSSHRWSSFKDHQIIAPGTYTPLSGPEKGLPHSFYTHTEIQQLFSQFKDLHIILDHRGRWVIQATK